MTSVRRLLTRPISSTNTDASIASLASYVFGILVLVVGFTGVTRLNVSEVELLLAVLGVLNVSLLMIVFGQLIEIYRRLQALAPRTPETGQAS